MKGQVTPQEMLDALTQPEHAWHYLNHWIVDEMMPHITKIPGAALHAECLKTSLETLNPEGKSDE